MAMAHAIRRTAAAGLVCWELFGGSAATAQNADSAEQRSRIQLIGQARSVMEWVMSGARRRLAEPACQALFGDFADRNGRTLAAVLQASGRTPAEYLDMLVFVDADISADCRGARIRIAVTAPGSRVIHVCSRRFVTYFRQDTSVGEILLIHELLHALGLGENPPTSDQITDRVNARCGRKVDEDRR
jgi:hypothetical protein